MRKATQRQRAEALPKTVGGAGDQRMQSRDGPDPERDPSATANELRVTDTQAVRQRVNVLWAMVRDHRPYREQPPPHVLAA
jgi:hypothetical protein